ncbi:MaoC/PaaZ C-terminal domain-containing protein [Hydrogenophaga sp. BPS33]|uniref:MaoC/PaaZ C-terminal domain-containing protein n=1 Tax=Hydrogenophaga sp. BPS33 TaxID=2651974 RepID=UPI00131FC3B4|nr:MaoC/PaaZ C-terminal domain-containing protein [Hydrogenophaga sp. BPS33]QHE83395.1 enoyl-CoA hydratase [Hydrogenophaga sp. BPS33]
MALDMSSIGRPAPVAEVAWDSRDAMLYAIGVGAGQQDPGKELQFTTENSEDFVQCVLPTYAVVIMQNAGNRPFFGDIDRSKSVHAEQGFELFRPLPVNGKVRVTNQVVAIEDKGSGALIRFHGEAFDVETDELLMTSTSASFVRDAGGFDPGRKSVPVQPMPETEPDVVVEAETRQDQALLYRLSGDRNPLHSDPSFAKRGGFPRPILHGMCTYGVTGRLLLNAFCDGDPSRVRSMSARFTRPVMPGDTLKVLGWHDSDGVRFRTLNGKGEPVMDYGSLKFATESRS